MKSPTAIVTEDFKSAPAGAVVSVSVIPATSAAVFPVTYSANAATCSFHSFPIGEYAFNP
jgi:hypothetical protein